jgi:multidrug efflux system outer membrane protein
MHKLIVLSSLAALLTGCAVGPNYQAPQPVSPASFRQAGSPRISSEPTEANWWSLFRDPVLDRLIADALVRNHDVRIASANLAEARALRRGAQWAFAPSGAAGGAVQRGRPSEAEAVAAKRPVTEVWSAGFDAAWEIDLFGRTRRGVEAAAAELGAADAALRHTQVALLAEVAANYFALRHAEAAVALVTGQIAALRQGHLLTEQRVAAGRGTALDTARTEALLRETEAGLPEATRTVLEHRHRLAVLVGVTPGELEIAPRPLASLPPEPVHIGAPADLLRRRPDVRQAERMLAAATARVGVDTAALFPEVSVLGFLHFVGLSSRELGDADARSWSVAPTIRWRLLDYGKLRAQLAASRARADGALATYERTVLRALEETENALARYGAAVTRVESLESRLAAAQRARTLSARQYEAGGADPLARLDAERTALAAERDVISARTGQQLALVALYKALGGGWAIMPPASPAVAMAP